MKVAEPRVHQAIYERLTTDATLETAMGNLSTALHISSDPWPDMVRLEGNTSDPIIGPTIVIGSSGGTTDAARCRTVIAENVQALVKVVAPANSRFALRTVADQINALLDGYAVDIDGLTVLFTADFPVHYQQDAGGRTYQHLGSTWDARVTEEV